MDELFGRHRSCVQRADPGTRGPTNNELHNQEYLAAPGEVLAPHQGQNSEVRRLLTEQQARAGQ